MINLSARDELELGRLNVVSSETDKRQLFSNALSSKAVLQVGRQRWGFYEFKGLEDLAGTFFTGYLVKYRPEDEEEVVVPEDHSLTENAIRNRVTAKSRFFLHVATSVIAYHSIAGQIPRNTFGTRFVQVFRNAMNEFFVEAEIEPIGNDDELLNLLKRFSEVHNVSISLHPSNPSSRDIWKDVDERIRKINATKYIEKYEIDPRKGSLNVASDADITSKISMAQDGYGQAQITGKLDGKEQTVTTQDNPIGVILTDYDDEHPEQILPELTETILSLITRFKK